MTSNFPTSKDNLGTTDISNNTVDESVNGRTHSAMHNDANDAIDAIQDKVGTGAATPSADTVLRGTGSGTTDYGKVDTARLASPTGADTNVATGTAGNDTEFAQWNADGDVVSNSLTPSGSDTNVVTGTAGLNNDLGLWNSDGDLVSITPNTALSISGGNLNVSGITTAEFDGTTLDTDENLAADSDTKIPTQQAVKGYVDANTGVTTSFQESARTNLSGATTPEAVYLNPDGFITPAQADHSSSAKSIGFVTTDETIQPNYSDDSGSPSNTTSFSYTAPAGDDRILFVHILQDGTNADTAPSSVTFDGNAMTQADFTSSGASSGQAVFYRFIGSSGTGTTGTISITNTATNTYPIAVTYNDVDQSSGVQATSSATNNGDSISDSVVPNKDDSIIFGFAIGPDQGFDDNGQYTYGELGGVGDSGWLSQGYKAHSGTNSVTLATSGSGTNTSDNTIALIEVLGSGTSGIDVTYEGLLGGFSGLTPGETYYVQNTRGNIGTSTGSTTVRVGKARDASTLLIVQ